MKIKFLNKAVLVETKKERLLVLGDLHFGYGAEKRVHLGSEKEEIVEIGKIFEENKGVCRMIVLGDLKHGFGRIYAEEREYFAQLQRLLEKNKCELVLVKGNHDVLVPFIKELNWVKIVESLIIGKMAFLHGDARVEEAENESVKSWFVGHGHPAVKIREGVKEESYKCFLSGKFKGKEVVILPSFFSGNYGSDPREFEMKMGWKFDLNKFKVLVIGDDGEVRDFGMLGKLGE